MKNSYLQELISKIKKRRKKNLYADDLKKIIHSLMKAEYTDTKAYKLIYYLKSKGYLISLKKTIFYCKFPEDTADETELVENYYWALLHAHCTEYLKKNRYVGGVKALELSYQNYDIPENILVVTANKQAKEVIVAWKIMHCKKYTSKKENYFSVFKKFTTKTKIGKFSFPHAKRELALLECLYNFDEFDDRYTMELVKKVCKRVKDLDFKLLASIIKLGKHHTSLNRLYKITKKINPSVAENLAPLIKQYSFFLDV